jgi:hypothetical protein
MSELLTEQPTGPKKASGLEAAPTKSASDLLPVVATNQHIPLLTELYQLLTTRFLVKARFEYQGYNGRWLYAGGQRLVWRAKKSGPLELGEQVRLLTHNLSNKGGGSNKYPAVGEKGSWCILEFVSYGPPVLDTLNGWSIHILAFDPIT